MGDFYGEEPGEISIHALREEGDAMAESATSRFLDFYPRPPRGGRRGGIVKVLCGIEFLSTPSARRATKAAPLVFSWFSFLSTPSARRATGQPGGEGECRGISIHALREEGDPVLLLDVGRTLISIHALREEGDWPTSSSRIPTSRFLSTPSARRATAPR